MEGDAVAAELRKIANLLAFRETKDLNKGERASILNAAGFSNKEIAALIGTTEGSIRASLSQARKKAAEE